ncbi:hypothetical protein M0R04_12690 [Candidatus Dojkabacteria bacterium]|jgi:hypothetical protein|nr:hypothetical protein [Candidatus Dojkabacteria bacterium]
MLEISEVERFYYGETILDKTLFRRNKNLHTGGIMKANIKEFNGLRNWQAMRIVKKYLDYIKKKKAK